jgi:hypothetical protein
MQPYVIGRASNCASLLRRLDRPDVLFFDVLTQESLAFYRLLNAANHLVFGGLGMPAWVQLDCCTLPSAMVGFSLSRAQLPLGLWGRLMGQVAALFGTDAQRQFENYEGPVPVSEYCAVPTFEEGAVVGFSLFSLLPHRGLGLRTKALALRAYGAQRQVGVAQYTNAAVRTHAMLGPLRILAPQAWPHSRHEDTFVYELQVPSAAMLDQAVRDGFTVRPASYDLEVDASAAQVRHAMARHGVLAIVAPGLVTVGHHKLLRLVRCA